MSSRHVVLALSILAASSVARADLLPAGQKGVKLSIRVDGELPAGKALVLAHTFRGADVVPLGSVAPVEWHPMGGAMSLVVVDAAEAAKVEAATKDMNRDAAQAITARGVPCSGPIEGVRTMPDTSPADEVRWTFTVKMTGATCAGQLVRTELLSKDGKVVETREADGGAPSPSASAATPASTANPTATSSPAAPPAEPPVARSGCGACDVGGGGNAAGAILAALGLAAALVKRRPARRRA